MDEVVRFECRDSNLEIYVVQPGEKVSIYGSCSFLCLAGNASVNDFNLPTVSCEQSNFLKISAPQRMDLPAILKVFNSGPNYKHARLKFRLKEVAPKTFEQIMEMIGTTQPAVFVFNKDIDAVEETVSGIIPNFLIHSSMQKQEILPPSFFISRDDFSIYSEAQEAQLRHQLNRLNQLREDGQRTTILPIGNKGAGKSNLMRNLVNRLLSKGFDHVYVLDGDIGQSEFTPNGCITLTKITSPLLDKPYGHLKSKFDNSFFYGDVSVRSFPLYMDIFERLYNKFKAISEPGSVCIINSMGWVIDEGAEILDSIISVAEPDLFIEIYRDPAEARYQFPNVADDRLIEIFANTSLGIVGLPQQKRLPPSLIRDLTIVGYFSSKLSRPSLSCFSKVAPYKMRFQNTTICVPVDLLVEDSHILSSINTQLMALCLNNSESNSRKLCGKDDMPSLCVLEETTSPLQCIGFGIIRGISVEDKAIYVVSPVDLQDLDAPPLLVRGMRIQTPDMFFTTNMYNKCPYVLNLPEKGPTTEKNLDGLYQPSVNTTQFKRSRKF